MQIFLKYSFTNTTTFYQIHIGRQTNIYEVLYGRSIVVVVVVVLHIIPKMMVVFS